MYDLDGKFKVFCMFLSFHDDKADKKKEMLFPKFIYKVEKKK